MSMITNESLVEHVDALFAYAMGRVKDRGAAQDLVQECLITAWRKRDDFEGRSALSTWLIGILKYKVLDYYRKSKRTPSQLGVEAFADEGDEWGSDPFDLMFDEGGTWKVDPSYGMKAFAVSPAEEADRSEVQALLQKCVKELPERMQLLFSMRDVEGASVSEAAASAGVTVGSAGVLLTRARHQLRACLQSNQVNY